MSDTVGSFRMIEAQTITSENFSLSDLDSSFLKFCSFENLSIEGGHVDSDFRSCSFTGVDWYWGLFNICVFVECQFMNCIFRGSGFPDCKFVECSFSKCQFVKDNLDGDCDFEGAIAYGCSIEDTIGFAAQIR